MTDNQPDKETPEDRAGFDLSGTLSRRAVLTQSADTALTMTMGALDVPAGTTAVNTVSQVSGAEIPKPSSYLINTAAQIMRLSVKTSSFPASLTVNEGNMPDVEQLLMSHGERAKLQLEILEHLETHPSDVAYLQTRLSGAVQDKYFYFNNSVLGHIFDQQGQLKHDARSSIAYDMQSRIVGHLMRLGTPSLHEQVILKGRIDAFILQATAQLPEDVQRIVITAIRESGITPSLKPTPFSNDEQQASQMQQQLLRQHDPKEPPMSDADIMKHIGEGYGMAAEAAFAEKEEERRRTGRLPDDSTPSV